jgi:hypothetical protein
VHTLDYPLAAEFWGITDPALAIKVHAIVGGTPAYRREFARDDVPAGPADFDGWVTRTVLNPASPLFREARYLLSDEPAEETVGGIPVRVQTGTVHDTAGKTSHQLDVVAFGLADTGPEPVIAIGEAKWGEVMSVAHLDRLRRIRGLLAARNRPGAAGARLLCFGGAGFTEGLSREAARHADVVLIGAGDLYDGS